MAECETGAVDVLEALLERDDSYPPWGFQLRGGVDCGQPLAIARVGRQTCIVCIDDRYMEMVTYRYYHYFLPEQCGLVFWLEYWGSNRSIGGPSVLVIMGTVDVLKAQIVRQDLAESWGFTLQGGADADTPLRMLTVTPHSPAARIGLKAGDMITEIGDQPTTNLTQQDALDTLAQYGLSLILTVERKARGSVPTNPVLHGPESATPIKGYQTYNMSGGTQRPVTQPGFYRSPPNSSPADSRRSFSPSFTYPKPQQQQRPTRPAIYQTYDLNGPRVSSPTAPKVRPRSSHVRLASTEAQGIFLFADFTAMPEV
ncbi:hypothetical protein NP493_101g06008 [Ridgeia piscesae]|uniref:PDZ domain-containing protein n=1 Tax=Ridgeia piscesae TaxID=27915 RepID=A0AAD9P7R2_RIDPI|nr:hypothetical protein NP493_101g06008 [Ridgeia piscesae]